MILRLAANAAAHTAGGVAMGLTVAFAACTVARLGKRSGRRLHKATVPDQDPTGPSETKRSAAASGSV